MHVPIGEGVTVWNKRDETHYTHTQTNPCVRSYFTVTSRRGGERREEDSRGRGEDRRIERGRERGKEEKEGEREPMEPDPPLYRVNGYGTDTYSPIFDGTSQGFELPSNKEEGEKAQESYRLTPPCAQNTLLPYTVTGSHP